MSYSFIFDPQTNNFIFTDSKKGRQIILRYLYQLGGSTGQFDILNKNLSLTTNKKLTDSQRQKRNQKKKLQLKRKKMKKQFIEKQALEQMEKIKDLISDTSKTESEVNTTPEVEKGIFSIEGLSKKIASVEKKYIGFSDYIEKLTDDPAFFGSLGVQGTGYIVNTHKMLQESLKEINEAQEKYNKLETQYTKETDTSKKETIKAELSKIFDEMVRLSDKIKKVQDYISQHDLSIKQEKNEKTSDFIWKSIEKKIKEKEDQIQKIEILITKLIDVDESKKEKILIDFQYNNSWFTNLLQTKSWYTDLLQTKSYDFSDIDIEKLQEIIDKIKISIDVIQQIKVETDPRTGFPIGENAGFLDYMLWFLNFQNKTNNLLKDIKIPPKYSIAVKNWLKSLLSSPTEGKIQLIEKFNKMAEKNPKQKPLTEDVDDKTVKKAYRSLSKFYHPDKGGTDEEFAELNSIQEKLLKNIEGLEPIPESSENWKNVVEDTIENLFGDPVDEALYNLQQERQEGKVIVPKVEVDVEGNEFIQGQRKLFGMDAKTLPGTVPFRILKNNEYKSDNPEFAKYYEKIETITEESVSQLEGMEDLSQEKLEAFLDNLVDDNNLPDVTLNTEQKEKIETVLQSSDLHPSLRSYVSKGLNAAMKVLPLVVGLSTRSSRSFSIPAALNVGILAVLSISGVDANIVADIKPNQVIGQNIENLVRDKMDEGHLLGVEKQKECTWFTGILEGVGPSFTQQINFRGDLPMSYEQDFVGLIKQYRSPDSEPLKVVELESQTVKLYKGNIGGPIYEQDHKSKLVSFLDLDEVIDSYIIGEEFYSTPLARNWRGGSFVSIELSLGDFDLGQYISTINKEVRGNIRGHGAILTFEMNSIHFTIPCRYSGDKLEIPYNYLISSTEIIDFLQEKLNKDSDSAFHTILEKLKLAQAPSSIPKTKIITVGHELYHEKFPGNERESFSRDLSYQLSQNLQRGKTYRIHTAREHRGTFDETISGHASLIKVDNDGNILFFETSFDMVQTLESWTLSEYDSVVKPGVDWEYGSIPPVYSYFQTYSFQVLDTPIEILPTTVKDLFFVPLQSTNDNSVAIPTDVQDSTDLEHSMNIPDLGILSLETFKEKFNIGLLINRIKYYLSIQKYFITHLEDSYLLKALQLIDIIPIDFEKNIMDILMKAFENDISDEQIRQLFPNARGYQKKIIRQKLLKLHTDSNDEVPIVGFVKLILDIFSKSQLQSLHQVKEEQISLEEKIYKLEYETELAQVNYDSQYPVSRYIGYSLFSQSKDHNDMLKDLNKKKIDLQTTRDKLESSKKKTENDYSTIPLIKAIQELETFYRQELITLDKFLEDLELIGFEIPVVDRWGDPEPAVDADGEFIYDDNGEQVYKPPVYHKYIDLFRQNGIIDMNGLLTLDEDQLQRMDIPRDDKNKLLEAIHKYKNQLGKTLLEREENEYMLKRVFESLPNFLEHKHEVLEKKRYDKFLEETGLIEFKDKFKDKRIDTFSQLIGLNIDWFRSHKAFSWENEDRIMDSIDKYKKDQRNILRSELQSLSLIQLQQRAREIGIKNDVIENTSRELLIDEIVGDTPIRPPQLPEDSVTGDELEFTDLYFDDEKFVEMLYDFYKKQTSDNLDITFFEKQTTIDFFEDLIKRSTTTDKPIDLEDLFVRKKKTDDTDEIEEEEDLRQNVLPKQTVAIQQIQDAIDSNDYIVFKLYNRSNGSQKIVKIKKSSEDILSELANEMKKFNPNDESLSAKWEASELEPLRFMVKDGRLVKYDEDYSVTMENTARVAADVAVEINAIKTTTEDETDSDASQESMTDNPQHPTQVVHDDETNEGSPLEIATANAIKAQEAVVIAAENKEYSEKNLANELKKLLSEQEFLKQWEYKHREDDNYHEILDSTESHIKQLAEEVEMWRNELKVAEQKLLDANKLATRTHAIRIAEEEKAAKGK